MTRQRPLRGHTHRRVHTHEPTGGASVPKRPARLTAVRRCVDGGKIRYPHRREAELMLASMNRANPQRREKHSYRCPDCAGWHLTSWTTSEHEDYVAVAFSAGAPSYRIYPLTDYPPTAESPRAPRDLRSITATLATVPTPAEVAVRTATAPIETPEPEPAPSGEPNSPAVPSPAEVAARRRAALCSDSEPMVKPVAPPVFTTASPSATLPRPTVRPPSTPTVLPTPVAPPTRPTRSMPSPAEVAARTVPIKRAEAARREAEAARERAVAIAEANTAATHRNPSPTLKFRDRLRTLLRHLAVRLRRS
ncbi:hypothetical protein ACQP06_25190 [Nocardia sp. CA-136227]|uniref:hypothetical protein n=1 Tax=Nocardia sp. CA-136227 TaxID=3239979 RepID=UPI003D963BFF